MNRFLKQKYFYGRSMFNVMRKIFVRKVSFIELSTHNNNKIKNNDIPQEEEIN